MAGEEGEEVTGLISVINADARRIPLADSVVQTAITSVPYWGLRAYLPDGHPLKHLELGLERTPEEYLEKMVSVFREVWRVMRPDGTLWLNIGDCYAGTPNGRSAADTKALGDDDRTFRDKPFSTVTVKSKRLPRGNGRWGGGNNHAIGLKPKDLVMMPARLALALQADGWWVRSCAPWLKRSAMPESVADRPSTALEYIYLLSKQERYFYDGEAIRKPTVPDTRDELWGKTEETSRHNHEHDKERGMMQTRTQSDGYVRMSNPSGRNRRNSDWFYESLGLITDPDGFPLAFDVNPQPYKQAHYATFPEKLVEPMVLAGSSPRACETCGAPWERAVETPKPPIDVFTETKKPKDGYVSVNVTGKGMGQKYQDWRNDNPSVTTHWRPTCACPPERNTGAGRCIVLDPFAGTCTAGRVAVKHGRRFVGLELKPEYIELARERTDRTQMVMQV